MQIFELVGTDQSGKIDKVEMFRFLMLCRGVHHEVSHCSPSLLSLQALFAALLSPLPLLSLLPPRLTVLLVATAGRGQGSWVHP